MLIPLVFEVVWDGLHILSLLHFPLPAGGIRWSSYSLADICAEAPSNWIDKISLIAAVSALELWDIGYPRRHTLRNAL